MTMKIQTTTHELDYQDDPLAIYAQVANQSRYSVLLESAEVDSKDDLKSLMLIDACLRLECNGDQVQIDLINSNGRPVLNYLNEQLAAFVVNSDKQQTKLQFAKPEAGLNEDERLKVANPFEPLRLIHQLGLNAEHPFATFLGGVFGYDMLGVVEELPSVPTGKNSCPDYVFYLAESLLVTCHQARTAELIFNNYSDMDEASVQDFMMDLGEQIALAKQIPLPEQTYLNQQDVIIDKSDDTFKQDVINLKEQIVLGNIFQVVPSRTFSLPCHQPLAAYKKLKQQNPSPYMFYMKDPDFQLFGASPESAVKYEQAGNEIEVYPIAGTRGRGFNPDGSINLDLDSRIEQELRSDKKELSEHMMLVDLARNDIARVSEPGTRYVCDLQKVDRYSYVMHLVSRVKGQLRSDLDPLHAYQACLNMGTLVGAPKIKAAELIRKTEQAGRGSYGGAVGYLAANGDMDTCIVIRSAFVKDDIAHVQAGAGVVYDSDPQSEADETRSKAQAVLNAIITSQTKPEDQE